MSPNSETDLSWFSFSWALNKNESKLLLIHSDWNDDIENQLIYYDGHDKRNLQEKEKKWNE